MTRRDYELLSSALRASSPGTLNLGDRGNDEARGYWAAVRCIAEAIKSENPAFDVGRFLADAGLKS